MKIYELGTYSHEGGAHLMVTSPEELTEDTLGEKLRAALVRVAARVQRTNVTNLESLFDDIADEDLAAVGLERVEPAASARVSGWSSVGHRWDYDNDLTTATLGDLTRFDWPDWRTLCEWRDEDGDASTAEAGGDEG